LLFLIKASLVLYTRQLKEDNGKTKTKRRVVRSPWRQSGSSPVGSQMGSRRSEGRKDLWNRCVLKSGMEERGSVEV